MSQKKVLEYKAEKQNRKENLKKQKRQAVIGKVIAGVCVVAVIGIIGFVAVNNASSKGEGTDANTVSISSLNDYVATLAMDEAMASFDSDEVTEEAVEENDAAEDNATE